jgi:type I restriction enzyme R subunit
LLIRAYNNLAPEILQAGYSQTEAEKIKERVNYYAELRDSIKHYSGDYIDLKKYEPDMRQMLDMYLTADPSRTLSNLGEASLLQLIVDCGIVEATNKLPKNIKQNHVAMSEAIENNMRKTIIQEMPFNPAYYEKMSKILLDLIALRKKGAIAYEELLKKYEEFAKKIVPKGTKSYPDGIDTEAKEALYDNLNENEELAIALHEKIMLTKDDNFRGTFIKKKKIEIAIRQVLKAFKIENESEVSRIFELVLKQKEY